MENALIEGAFRTLGKTEDKEKGTTEEMRWLDSITGSMDMSDSNLWEIVKDRGAWHAAAHGLQRVRHDLATKQQQTGDLLEFEGNLVISDLRSSCSRNTFSFKRSSVRLIPPVVFKYFRASN